MKFFRGKFGNDRYELTVLRWFINNFVSKEDIAHYYKVAPTIVETINNDENKMLFMTIYDNIVYYYVK